MQAYTDFRMTLQRAQLPFSVSEFVSGGHGGHGNTLWLSNDMLLQALRLGLPAFLR